MDPNASFFVYHFRAELRHVKPAVWRELVVPASDSLHPVACTGGARACPPEDCGGPGGYKEFLEALSDPGHVRHQESIEWVGGGFGPEYFDPADVVFDDPQARWKLAFGAR